MNFPFFRQHETPPAAETGKGGPELLAPADYFTGPRCDELKTSLNSLGSIQVDKITQI